MIILFPPSIKVSTQREMKFYTQRIDTEGIFPGTRWVRHTEALNDCPLGLDTHGKPSSSGRGRNALVSLWDALGTRILPGRMEEETDISLLDASGRLVIDKVTLKAKADIFVRRSQPTGRDFIIYVRGALRERDEISDRRARISKDILKPEPCAVLIVYSETQNIKDERKHRDSLDEKARNIRSYCPWLDEVIYGAQVEKINKMINNISEQ